MSDSFSITVAPSMHPGLLVLALSGVIDGHTVSEFDAQMRELTTAARGRIVLDLSNVNFISSAGIGAIIAQHHACRQRGSDLRLAAPSQSVYEVIRILGLDTIMKVSIDVAAACRIDG